MKSNRKRNSIEFSSKTVVAIILLILFMLLLFFTVSHYKNQINKSTKNKSKEEIDNSFELVYSEDKECLSYLDNLKEINYNAINVSNYKESIFLYNTVYEDCSDGTCDDETKKEIEKDYIVCLTDIKYSSDDEDYDIEEAIEQKKITIEELEKRLNDDGLSKVIIKEEIEYDTTAPTLDVGYVYIEEGQQYTVDRFVKSCVDDSGEKCILKFTDDEMGEYEKAGTYDVEISAKDSSGNEVKKTTKLVIKGKTVTQKPVNPPQPVYYCKEVDGKYYDKSGKVVSKEEYEKSCDVPQKNICKEVDGKYYDKNGTEVSKEEYEKSCGIQEKNICKEVDGKYYDKNGTEVSKEEYEKSCTTQ